MLRMLGLFLILPVFALYAEKLPGTTPFQIGLALGIYGLTQALLQIPFGMASDRFGRKPIIVLGLLVFIAGSVIAANATTIEGIIAGRAMQGAGAIAAAVLAMLADLTREEQRTKAMALVGISIGASFIFSLMIGPVLNSWIGIPGIFWLTAVLAAAGIVVLLAFVPSPTSHASLKSKRSLTSQFRDVLSRPDLLRLDIGIFALHCTLMAIFIAIPLALVHETNFAESRHWQVYAPALLLGIAIMVPFMLYSDRKGALKPIFLGAIGLLVVSQAIFYATFTSFWGIMVGLIAFFAAFNLLEATLPSLITKTAPVDSKGMAIGVYNSFQFFGAFVGGALGGWLFGEYGQSGVYIFTGAVLFLWVLLAAGMKEPTHHKTHTLRFGPLTADASDALATQLEAVEGVSEVVMMSEEGLVYVQADGRRLDRSRLESIVAATAEA